jgi:hypothetical protein
MKPVRTALIIAAFFSLVGCTQNQQKPLQILALIDVSASIEPEAQKAAFDAVANLMTQLHRGDALTVIPITGDAENQSQGRVLRFVLPEQREAYDQDLRRAVKNVRELLETTKAETLLKPGSRTDILGALHLAEEEMRLGRGSRNTIIVILSDLIQDDDRLDFETAPALSSRATARNLAMRLSRESDLHITGVPVFAGLLRSRDLTRLHHERRQAIQEFWRQYITSLGATLASVVDGPGLAPSYVAGQR